MMRMARNFRHLQRLLHRPVAMETIYVMANKNAHTSGNPVSPYQYCLDLVRTNDYENFLSTLLVKDADHRECILAVRAFNVEIASIASSVTDEKIAQMRLQFWSNIVDQLFDKNREDPLPQHPVIHQLNVAITVNKLNNIYFQRLIQSRQRPSNQMFATKTDLEEYVDASNASVYHLLLKIVGVQNMDVDHAISHMAKAQGICNLLRALAVVRARGLGALPPIPQAVLLAHGCSYEQILRQRPDDIAAQDCIFDVASLASVHLEKARKLNDKVPDDAKALFLPGVAIGRFLNRLRRVDFRLTDPSLRRRDAMLPFLLYWSRFRGAF